MSRPTDQGVIARPTVQQAASGPGIEYVVTVPGVEPLAAAKAIDQITPVGADESLIVGGTGYRIELRDSHRRISFTREPESYIWVGGDAVSYFGLCSSWVESSRRGARSRRDGPPPDLL